MAFSQSLRHCLLSQCENNLKDIRIFAGWWGHAETSFSQILCSAIQINENSLVFVNIWQTSTEKEIYKKKNGINTLYLYHVLEIILGLYLHGPFNSASQLCGIVMNPILLKKKSSSEKKSKPPKVIKKGKDQTTPY